MRPLLALDFDGVVSDSAPESFLVALRTWAELGSSAPEAKALGDDALPAIAEVRAHPWYPGFLELMPLGNRAEDYAVVLGILEEGARVPDQAGYDARRGACDESWLARFHARFYERRHALARDHADAWFGLMGAYPGIAAALRGAARDWRLAIATAKDRPSVRALLGAYGLADLFDDDHLLDKEAGRAKTAHLARLHERHGVPYARTLFVDDKPGHLERVAALGVRCALAAWGYNGPGDRARALEQGHLVLEIGDLDRALRALAAPSALGGDPGAP